jgi:transcription elongation factor Elf1
VSFLSVFGTDGSLRGSNTLLRVFFCLFSGHPKIVIAMVFKTIAMMILGCPTHPSFSQLPPP